MVDAALLTARTLATVTRSSTEGWLSAYERRFVRSGWPGHGVNWTNMHASRFLTRVRRRASGAPPPRARVPLTPRSRLRAGIIGRFQGLLGFPPSLFDAVPADMALTIFDVSFDGRWAEWLRRTPHTYHAVALEGDGAATEQTARVIADADLDLLLNVNWKADAHRLLDVVSTRCVANYCVGSDLLHHPRVDIELVWQMQPDNEVRDGRMWCTQAQLPVSDTFVCQISGLYDRRGLSLGAPRPWAEREPLIVSHGSLYKFAVPEFADCMLDVLACESRVQWVLVGKDNGSALSAIRAAAGRRGLGGRVHYEGAFNSVRDAEGAVADAGWLKVQELLCRARLAPDPFPIGSGSSRFEAYALGAPCPHMAVTPRTAKLMSAELPVLAVPVNTVTSVDDYRELSIRCLSDEAVATRIQQHQLAAATRASDAARWWSDIEAAFDAWRRREKVA
jgi:hypothetical protein